jgi:hypothetical protein
MPYQARKSSLLPSLYSFVSSLSSPIWRTFTYAVLSSNSQLSPPCNHPCIYPCYFVRQNVFTALPFTSIRAPAPALQSLAWARSQNPCTSASNLPVHTNNCSKPKRERRSVVFGLLVQARNCSAAAVGEEQGSIVPK